LAVSPSANVDRHRPREHAVHPAARNVRRKRPEKCLKAAYILGDRPPKGVTDYARTKSVMGPLFERAPALAADVVDLATAALSAAWPRSLAAREVERLAIDGYAVGELCDVDFSLSFDSAESIDLALAAVALEGFTVGDRTQAGRGFVTVRCAVRLRAYDLVRATSRLNRAVWRYGGFGTVIGPAEPSVLPPDSAEHAA